MTANAGSDGAAAGTTEGNSDDSQPKKPDYTPKHAPFDWHRNGLIFEFKASVKQDPFYTAEEAKKMKTIEKPDDDCILTRGQLAEYAAELMNCQHRTHAFQILVLEEHARFIYWDRAGSVVSERFNYIKEPQVIPEFLWAYHHLSHRERGWDDTVTSPSDEEVEEFRTHVEAFIAAMQDPANPQRPIENAENTLDESYPPYKMTVGAVKTGKTHEIIVQRPFEVSYHPVGRGTRAYIAWSLTAKKIVFLKDSWRVDIAGLTDEDSIYCKLQDAKVEFVPEVLCAGDVCGAEGIQVTRADAIWDGENRQWKVPSSTGRKHYHHRVLQELAYPLWTCTNSRQYTEVFRDSFKGVCIIWN